MITYLFAAARSASQRLRGEVDNLITQVSFYQSGARQRTNITVVIIQCANEMWSHWNNTNMSFQQRITESNDAHNKLQSHLSKTMQEIYDQEKHIEALKKAIRDKGPPLKVVVHPIGASIADRYVRCPKPDWRLELTVQMLSFAEILLITDLLRRSSSKSVSVYLYI